MEQLVAWEKERKLQRKQKMIDACTALAITFSIVGIVAMIAQ